MRKRILSLACAVVILMTVMLPLVASARGAFYYIYSSNGKNVNMRSKPVTHANNRIFSLPYGTEVQLIQFVDSKWAEVGYKGEAGYVMRRYLVSSKPAPKKQTGGTTTTTTSPKLNFSGFAPVKYNAILRPSKPGGSVNLRWAPSKSYAIRQKVYEGQKFEVIAQDKTWAQVRLTGTDIVGFIMRTFLTEVWDDVGVGAAS